MNTIRWAFYLLITVFGIFFNSTKADIPLYWWRPHQLTNFGDELSMVLVERILNREVAKADIHESKLLAVGSILQFAKDGDVIWGAGINGKHPLFSEYSFTQLDVKCVRGPLTKAFLEKLGIECPAVYGDPALLTPILFPEFKATPEVDYVVVPHISEINLFEGESNIVLPTEPWDVVVRKIISAKFVISSSLHGIVIAEAFGIPAKLIRVTSNEPLFKYLDYYQGTGRPFFKPAYTIEQAIDMGGEPPIVCDLEQLLNSFPYEYFSEK